jgi:hypothetical protein
MSRAFLSDKLGTQVSIVSHSLGHHWKFSIPSHWEWRAGVRQSFLVPNLAARIDYQQMLYEAAIGLVALALLFLLLSPLGMATRKIKIFAKVEIILMRTRLRNWRHRDRKNQIA